MAIPLFASKPPGPISTGSTMFPYGNTAFTFSRSKRYTELDVQLHRVVPARDDILYARYAVELDCVSARPNRGFRGVLAVLVRAHAHLHEKDFGHPERARARSRGVTTHGTSPRLRHHALGMTDTRPSQRRLGGHSGTHRAKTL
eukprot:CAMPEP_0117646644 /NCGR_PEP_ID=MMETSP0802-20121206/12194_1 /TAXON_ID=38833 /ORGANISM="Micromonas sp., Strain CCMP2099" /LENGTH=143 /DNA_ID=CAMNT_0005452105 /DNA_START=30 /DNA_END=458 /DNA_ORIENTATION=+